MLLPPKSYVSKLIIRKTQEACGQGAAGLTMNNLRMDFWMQKGSASKELK